MSVDGKLLRKLTANAAEHFAFQPAWSSDARKIVFTEVCDDCRQQIRIIDVALSRPSLGRRIALGSSPHLSTDGRRIVFEGGGGGLYTVRVDGLGLRRVPRTSLANDPKWSPDGAKILFTRRELGGATHIYTVTPDGMHLERLTSGARSDVNPAWSPDGTRIAFARHQPNGLWQIFSMKADGSDVRKLSDGKGSDTSPGWSPSGSRLTFVRSRADSHAVYLMNADGSGVRRLTEEGVDAVDPAWSPKGQYIAFVQRG